jgi:excisionase family DNA binding protein
VRRERGPAQVARYLVVAGVVCLSYTLNPGELLIGSLATGSNAKECRDRVEQTGNHSEPPPFPLTVALAPDQLELLAFRVADLLERNRDDGFVDVDGAAEFLCLSRRAVYRLVERDRVPHHRAGGRLLFDRRELRVWVERGD